MNHLEIVPSISWHLYHPIITMLVFFRNWQRRIPLVQLLQEPDLIKLYKLWFHQKIEWDLANGPLSKLLELLDTQVEGSVQWVLLETSWNGMKTRVVPTM